MGLVHAPGQRYSQNKTKLLRTLVQILDDEPKQHWIIITMYVFAKKGSKYIKPNYLSIA